MKFLILLAFVPTMAWAGNQTISCFGLSQTADLEIEFTDGKESSILLEIVDGDELHEAALTKRRENRRDGTVNYSDSKGRIKATIPLAWVNKRFPRFSKHDQVRGSEITEQTKFSYSYRPGKDISLNLWECESSLD